jgi:formamidase
MNGLGGLNKSENGVVIGLVQLQLPVSSPRRPCRADRADRGMVAKARRNLGTMDLVVFPEYALHGLSMDTNPAIMCSGWTAPRSRPSGRPASTIASGAAFRSWS